MRQLAGEAGALGYPRKAAGFSEKTTGGYSHSNPVAFNAGDFTDLDAALNQLATEHQAQFMALMMFYKPWVVDAMKADGWPFNNSTYYKRLHNAHSFVSRLMDDMKPKVEYIAINSVG